MYNRILSRKIEKSSKSVLLLGARQVGKSTLLKGLKPDLIINLSREDEYFNFQGNNLELQSRIEAVKPKTIFIDEIQRIPRLLNTIQAILDDHPEIKIYLSGSSARKLKRGRANLLPGRLFTYQMNPLSILEIGSEWNEKLALQYGFLPGVYSLKKESEKKKLLQSYANTYLKEEIMAESLVRSLDGFEVSQDRIGAMWEYLIFNQIMNSSSALDRDCHVYNFRTRGGLEVDFIFACKGKKTAIECEASQQIDASDYQNLMALEKYYPKIQKMVIYRGSKERKENGIWIVPIKKALEILGLK